MTEEMLQEIEKRCKKYSCASVDDLDCQFDKLIDFDVPALIAEVRRLREALKEVAVSPPCSTCATVTSCKECYCFQNWTYGGKEATDGN